MKLIIGLGNPGKEYEKTRHNIGFITLDAVAQELKLNWRLEPKLKGMLAEIRFQGHRALLLKPMTYMNLSGESVIAVMKYYKINTEDILVISDDLDSYLGRVRVRDNGSAGGHNGHKNIIQMIGTSDYKRIKIGIDRNAQIPVVDWVLSKFTEDDMLIVNQSVNKVSKAILDFIMEIPFVKIASLYSEK